MSNEDAREELADVIDRALTDAENRLKPVVAPITDAVLTSLWLRKVKAEVWDEAARLADRPILRAANPYREKNGIHDGYGRTSNPYRSEP